MRRALVLTTLCCCALSAPASAQTGGTITHYDALFVRTTSSFDATPEAQLKGVSSPLTQNNLFEHGWWFRVAGDAAESRLGIPDSEVYDGDRSTITWNDVGGRGLFSAQEIVMVRDPGLSGPAIGGYIATSLDLTNLSTTTPLTVSVFHLADLDVAGSTNDSAALVEYPHLIQISDPSGNYGQYWSAPEATYIVRPFGATSVREILNDGSATTFDNSGLPFAAGDITLGCQVDLVIPQTSDRGMTVFISVNSPLWCSTVYGGVFCDGFESAGSGFWSLATPF